MKKLLILTLNEETTMKLKIISAIALSAISISAIAAGGHGYRIINTTITGTPGSGFIEGYKAKSMSAQPTVSTSDAQGRISEYIKIQANHGVNLSNFSKVTARYTYTYDLDCRQASAHYSRTVDIFPNGTFYDNSLSYTAVQELSEGNWPINAMTKIDGSEYAVTNAHANLKVRR